MIDGHQSWLNGIVKAALEKIAPKPNDNIYLRREN